MRRILRAVLRVLGFEKLFVLLTTSFVVLAVVLVAFVTVARVERFAEDQALARVELAAANAQRSLTRAGDEILTSARLLAERPTLRRYLDGGDAAALREFLERFRDTSRLSGCAVVREDAVVAAAGEALPWGAIVVAQGAHVGRFVATVDSARTLVLGASGAVPGTDGAQVLAARVVGGETIEEARTHAGLPVVVFSRESVFRSPEGAELELRRHVIEWEEERSASGADGGAYRAAAPLTDPAGNVVGLVEASLARAESESIVRRFRESLAMVCAAVSIAGAIGSALLARRLVRPIERLRLASERIARGDLSTPIPLPAGREVGALATTMDDMRSRLLRQTGELRRRRAEADAILGGIAEGVFSVDAERRIRYLNPQAALLLGVREEEAIGAFCGDVLRPREEGGVRPCEEKCPIVHARFRTNATAVEHLVGRDGTQRTVVITSAAPAVDGAEGGESGGEGALQFQVIRGETSVESSRRMRDAILANLSHEFRTPLAAQLGSIELLRERLPSLNQDEIHGLVFSIERGTVRLMQLIDNLLESVRIEAGQDSIRRQPVALDEVVEEAAELAAPLLALRDQRLEIELPYPLAPVSGDRTRLVQVLVNLLGNANKFSPPGSSIRIGGSAAEGTVTLWVEDEGPGIPEQESEAVFERFTRSTGEEPAESGMGLGLWIVRSIVERHGGMVAVTGGAGGGTRLGFTLPTGERR